MNHEEYMRRINARLSVMGQRKPSGRPAVIVGNQPLDRIHLDAALEAMKNKSRSIKAGREVEDVPSAIGRFTRPVYEQAQAPVHAAPIPRKRRKPDHNKRAGKVVHVYSK